MPIRGRHILPVVVALLLSGCGGGGGGGKDTAAGKPTPSTTSATRTPSAAATSSAAAPAPTAPTAAGRRGNRPISDYPDACKLLTQADVRSVYPRAAVSPGLPGRGTVGDKKIPKPIRCEYDVPVGTEVSSVSVSINTLVYDARHLFDVGMTVNSPHLKRLPGIGDAAYDPGRVIATTDVLQGGVECSVEILDAHRRRSQPQTEALARRVAANIRAGAAGAVGLTSGG